jgi:hypothetical protein
VVTGFNAADADLSIDNGGTPQVAAALLTAWLRGLRDQRTPQPLPSQSPGFMGPTPEHHPIAAWRRDRAGVDPS